jgi:hypothetical protein
MRDINLYRDFQHINACLEERRRFATQERLARQWQRQNVPARQPWRRRLGWWLVRLGLKLQQAGHNQEQAGVAKRFAAGAPPGGR